MFEVVSQITYPMYEYINTEIFKNNNVIGCINGHTIPIGRHANIMKNPMWIILEENEEIFLMYCEPNKIVKLCRNAYIKIKEYENEHEQQNKLTWYIGTNGYVSSHIPKSNTSLYMHQIIMKCFGNGRGTSIISVDHIDRNPLNNSINNLRLATREEQENNSSGIMTNTKRNRQKIARPLPDGITQDMLKKYVVYYFNIYNKNTNKSREYFRVECHPKSQKTWETTKSGKVSIFEKLKQANLMVEKLDNM